MGRWAAILFLTGVLGTGPGCGDDDGPKSAFLLVVQFQPAAYDMNQLKIVAYPSDDATDYIEDALPNTPGALFGSSPVTTVIIVPDRWIDRTVFISVAGTLDGSEVVASGSTVVIPELAQVKEVTITLNVGAPVCGNGVIEAGEQCDASSFVGRTCASETGLSGGVLHCTAACRVDVSECSDCGNGAIEGLEECDGGVLAGETCGTKGFQGGLLSCDQSCQFDTSSCTGGCGNGQLEFGEICDGTDLGEQSCQTAAGLPGGQLRCTDACHLDVSDCHSCGNGVKQLRAVQMLGRGYDHGINLVHFEKLAMIHKSFRVRPYDLHSFEPFRLIGVADTDKLNRWIGPKA